MQRDELAAQAHLSANVVGCYEAIGLWDAVAPERLARLQRIAVLKALGFSLEQIAQALQSGVSIEQLRGMLRYRQCVDPTLDAADLTARIERIEELEKFPLDSHAT